jgi:hypothetical protein
MNETELAFLCYVAEGEAQHDGMRTGGDFRKVTAERLIMRRLLEKFDARVMGDDGFALEPERWRPSYRLTDAGVVALCQAAPEVYTSAISHPEMRDVKRARWMLVVNAATVDAQSIIDALAVGTQAARQRLRMLGLPEEPMKAYYFGYVDGGHFMHDVRLVHVHDDVVPWKDIDCRLQPGAMLIKATRQYYEASRDQQVQSAGLLHHLDGWTAIAFWDRSGDERHGSNSVFFFDKRLTFDEAVEQARLSFPEIVARMEGAGRLHEGEAT